MATPKLLLYTLLRRRRRCRSIPEISPFILSHSSDDSPSSPTFPPAEPHHPAASSRCITANSFFRGGIARFPSSMMVPSNCSSASRFYSTRRDSDFGGLDVEDESTQSELSDLGFFDDLDSDGPDNAEEVLAVSGIDGVDVGGEESSLAVQALISLLDGFHDLTGLPWWIVISASTVALRFALLPLLFLQLQKLRRIGELLPTLPSPFPTPLSGRSYRDQFTFFLREKRAVGGPSLLWLIALTSVQIPCFLLGMTTIRRMSLDHHPGFDCEGILWFQNLTEISHGVLGSIFPMLLAGLHLANVQVSLSSISTNSLYGFLMKCYKFYLQFLTVPIMVVGFCIPQASLVYWVTNGSFTLIQQLALNQADVREKMGLPKKLVTATSGDNREVPTLGMIVLDPPETQRMIPAENLSPRELVNISVQLLASGQQDTAITVLRMALDKDPEYVRALVTLGQTVLQKGQLVEAIQYFERAITKLLLIGQPTEVEDVDLLILASLWAGSAFARQGKYAAGIVHLERIAQLEEPQDPKSKAHYYEGLLLLASALANEGRNAEAEKYLRILVAYDPSYNKLLKELGNGEDNFIDELADSRRRDY